MFIIGKSKPQNLWFRVCFIKTCLIITAHEQCSLSYNFDLSSTDAIVYKNQMVSYFREVNVQSKS